MYLLELFKYLITESIKEVGFPSCLFLLNNLLCFDCLISKTVDNLFSTRLLF